MALGRLLALPVVLYPFYAVVHPEQFRFPRRHGKPDPLIVEELSRGDLLALIHLPQRPNHGIDE
jgi:hypothetical protein